MLTIPAALCFLQTMYNSGIQCNHEGHCQNRSIQHIRVHLVLPYRLLHFLNVFLHLNARRMNQGFRFLQFLQGC